MLIKDSMYIGESPWAENCVAVGDDMYSVRAREECQRFIDQIRRHYGHEPAGARLYIKSNPHDFGSYLSVECQFLWNPADDGEEEYHPSFEYALAIEGDDKGALQTWDTPVAA